MMSNFIQSVFLLFFVFFWFSPIYSQEEEVSNRLKTLQETNFYSLLSVGLTHSIYRDFATSPLFYDGVGIDISAAWLKESDQRERTFESGLGASIHSPRVPKSNFIQSGGLAGFANLRFFYQELWKLEQLSNAKNNTKIGGGFMLTQHVRGNPALQNNAIGLENLTNLMVSAQWRRDISRTEAKELNLLFFKLMSSPVKRNLRFLLNVGILNFNYRPGYAYTYDGEINGTETSPVTWAFSNYKWSMNGLRLRTQLEYIKYLANGNARSWSYVWEAGHAPGKYEAFQMAHHRIQYTIHFNTKKR